MKLFKTFGLLSLFALVLITNVAAQNTSGIKEIVSFDPRGYYDPTPHFSGNISGSGRFLVFESNLNLATYNPRNADQNCEIFLMDYAQRQIFQITNTKHALSNVNGSPTEQSNISVRVINLRADISNDGKWITFSSNATTTIPGNPNNNTNPGNFDGNNTGVRQILQQDGNNEIWLYQLPLFQEVDLKTGIIPTFVDLGIGNFTQVTNSPAAELPRAGQTNVIPRNSIDNKYPSIDDTGTTIAFESNRDLVAPFNAGINANDEIFVYKRINEEVSNIAQVTQTPASVSNPFHQIYNVAPSISGNGDRVVFASTATNPIRNGMIGGCNDDFNEEVHFSDLNEFGEPDGLKRQVTYTAIVDFEATVQLPYATNSISRDGRYIIFYSRAKHSSDKAIEAAKKVFLFDTTVATPQPPFNQCNERESPIQFRQIGPKFDADPVLGIQNGYIYSPIFTDYVNQVPNSVVFESRMNFRADGSVPPLGSTEGLNPGSSRPHQIFAYSMAASSSGFSRLTNSQDFALGRSVRVLPSNSKERVYLTSVADDNSRLNFLSLLTPVISEEDPTSLGFFTGASSLSINATPQQANGLTPNMLGSVVFLSPNIVSPGGIATNVSNSRNFIAPLQLHGVSLTIDGRSANITRVLEGQINFIVPKELTPGNKSVVINHNGFILRGNVNILGYSQPDILTRQRDNITEIIGTAYGRARIFNVTDPSNPRTEPFPVTTQTQNGNIPTKLRIFLTGVQGINSNSISLKIGSVIVPNTSITTNAVETDYPGVFSFDFDAPPQLDGARNVPVVVTVLDSGGQSSRVETTAPQINFLSSQTVATDLAVWRPGNGTWYILDSNGTNQIAVNWGTGNDLAAPGDYDGDGKTDFCVFRPSDGNWYLNKSSDNTLYVYNFGQNGDKIAQADYDGDGKTDFAVFRPSDGYWYAIQSSNSQVLAESLGIDGDKLIPSDFDGDGKADLAVWKDADGSFWVKGSVQNLVVETNFGQPGDKPVIGDYDGDGKADFATWRSSDNTWRILNSSSNQLVTVAWGDMTNDVAVPGDYDGDGKTDLAVWKSSGSQVGLWHIRKSSNGQTRDEFWGTTGDIPVPANW